MNLKIITMFILIAILSLTGCRITKQETIKEDITEELPIDNDSSTDLVTYGVAGLISTITDNGDNTGSIFVEGDLATNGAEYDKASVSISSDTKIYLNEEGGISDLEVGQYVQVFFEGPVMESYPVQAAAKQINVIDEPVFTDDPTESE